MENELFKLFNEAHLGNFTIITRALKDDNISMDNLVRYKGCIKRMRNSMRKLSTLYQKNANERYDALYERVMSLDYEVNKRIREKL